MLPTVEQICGEIERLQLMSSKDFTAMKSRWFRADRKEAADVNKFGQWLLANHYLTEFVVRMLTVGRASQLILDQYRIRDQVRTGPLAGAYVATDPLDRLVLIQVLSTSVTHDADRLKRALEVGRQLIGLQHPNICRCLALGESRGLHYLVRQHYEGETLGDILQKRGKLTPEQTARIFALAFEGLRALHERKVPGGALTADCILLTTSDKGAKAPKTVRILIASARKDVFSSTAIGGSAAVVSDELDLVPLEEAQPGVAGTTPAEDIFRLGCLMYRCLTEREPFSEDQLPRPTRPAQPIQKLAPEVPGLLAQTVEETIDIDPSRRAQNAGHIAKSLRVFLKTEEEAKAARSEEQIGLPEPTAVVMQEDIARERAAQAAEEEAEEEELEEEQKPRRPRQRKPAPAETEVDLKGSLREVWAEFRPQPRDLVYVAAGAVGIVFLGFLVHLLIGLDVENVFCLFLGASISFFVERFVRWREQRTVAET